MKSNKLNNKTAIEFIFAGNAKFTFLNAQTGNRFTYRVKKATDVKDLFFVSIMYGPDNDSSYQFIGCVRNNKYTHSKKSRVTTDAQSVKVFVYVLNHLINGDLPSFIEIWHEGSCGRCGRTLTVPDSIESGFGPECIKLVK